MNWDDLKLLLEVSRHPRLADVSVRTGLDPTTISRRLRRLEADLSLALFERTAKGHQLTSDGEMIARKAEALEQAAAEVSAISEREGPQATGRVRIGAPEGLGTLMIAPAIAGFSARHPGLGLDLIAMSGFVSVPKREADMSILLTRPQAGRLIVRKLSDYTLHLYASPHYLKGRGAIPDVTGLASHDLIGYVDDLIYSSQLRYHEEIMPGLTLKHCSPSIVAQWQMTRAGAGIAVLPHFLAANDPQLVQILPDIVRLERAFWLTIHEDVHVLARIRAVSQFLADLFGGSEARLIGE
ncbi:LysR family transcriptional regulator [Hyphomonas polymorpha]|uniref:LysR family transcriptional regulator n=1 Tax=Hyphomonas polymorpha TaxID=74319 RepID=UPI00054D5432|nr:LysR family transcriptional regulator [Hyphomonas polymorpha]